MGTVRNRRALEKFNRAVAARRGGLSRVPARLGIGANGQHAADGCHWHASRNLRVRDATGRISVNMELSDAPIAREAEMQTGFLSAQAYSAKLTVGDGIVFANIGSLPAQKVSFYQFWIAVKSLLVRTRQARGHAHRQLAASRKACDTSYLCARLLICISVRCHGETTSAVRG